ncbi:hypothetical protein F4781DRAFT_444690 [Annulohypoxylon bovei var. microspora]|nr:hypothetical protein F4781DRAFT_444690 [Annulohypoxylon bovei var. microspora]
MFFKEIAIASTLAALSAAADFSNGGKCDTTYYSSAPHTNTIDAATQLIGYFNNPSRNGKLTIGAMGAGSNYAVQRQVGYSHAYLDIVDGKKPTNDLNIDISEVTSGLELLMASCTTGQVILSGGQWRVGIAVENHVGKRDSAGRETRTPNLDLDTSVEISVPHIEKRDTTIDAGLYNYILSMHNSQAVDRVLGASLASWSDAESSAVNNFGQAIQDAISKAGTSSDDLNVFPAGSPYAAVLNIDDKDWSKSLDFVGGSSHLKQFIKASVKATADQKTILKTFYLHKKYPDFDVSLGKVKIGITIRRAVLKSGVCNKCKDIAPNPRSYDNTYPQSKPLPSGWDDKVYWNKRNIDGESNRAWDNTAFGDGNRDPSIATMLEGVLSGDFQFQYSTLIRQNVHDTTRQDGIVELTWLMGGSIEEAQHNQHYQGHNPGGRPDVLFVIHLHTDQIITIDGQQYIGVQAMNLMHSQEILVNQNRANVNQGDPNRSVRVTIDDLCDDNNSGENPQDGFAWYPGYQNDPTRYTLPGVPSYARAYEESLLIRFGVHLHENGLLGEHSHLFDDVELEAEAEHHWRYLDFRNLAVNNNVGPSTRPDGSHYQIPRGMPIRQSWNSNNVGYQP